MEIGTEISQKVKPITMPIPSNEKHENLSQFENIMEDLLCNTFCPGGSYMQLLMQCILGFQTAIKTKLVEFGSYVDDELPDYIMVMIANKRSQAQMIEDLNLFLAENSKTFCEWLHDLLLKLQEVTEGAFEVKVPLKRKSTEAKPVAKTDDNEALKISKLSRKPSPIRITSDADSKNEESMQDSATEGRKNSGKRKTEKVEKHQRREERHSSTVQSAITIQKRPTLPPSKQANPTLLKKAIQAAQVSTDNGEYNPEVPSSSEVDTISDAETKRRKREQLMEEHKKLQRLKSQQEEETVEPVLELQVAEDDDLFNTDESTGVKDRRIVMEKSPERESQVKAGKKEKGKKEKKSEKRKLEEEKDESGSGNDGDETAEKDKDRSVKTKGKRKKPKFIVTLEGVGSKFEDKYEKAHSKRKRRRKSAQRDEEQPEINRDVPVMPVYPQLIHGVHQVPGMISAHLNHPALPLQPTQSVHVLPPQATIITAPNIPVESTIQNVSDEVEFDEIDKSKEKCRFWPQCKNGDECPYYHPDVNCIHFPNCRYGQDCSYVHPPCKFGTRCTSTSCPYSHEEIIESTENETTLCRYHPFCTRSNCPFLHPVDKPCRYGKNCSRPGCVFKHSVPPTREQLKWVAPVVAKVHVSDRKFAVNEANTTALPVQ